MPRRAAGLTAIKVDKPKKPGRFGDGNGLYLLVRPDFTKFWLFRYTPTGGKMREMGLGRAGNARGEIKLADARERAAGLSGLIAAEISVDPHLLQTILQSHINDLLTEAADRFDPAGLGGDRSADP